MCGNKMTNLDWNGMNMYIEAQFPDEHSKMSHPYLYIVDTNGHKCPWTPSQKDMFSQSWSVVY